MKWKKAKHPKDYRRGKDSRHWIRSNPRYNRRNPSVGKNRTMGRNSESRT